MHRGYQKGDLLQFQVMKSEYYSDLTHPLNDRIYEITYVHSGLGMDREYVVLAIRPHEELKKYEALKEER